MKNELEKKVFSLPEKVKEIVVIDKSSLDRAHQALLYIKKVRKEISDFCDDNIRRLHEAHKEALAQKKKFEQPLIEAEAYLSPQISSYLAKLEQIRKAAEDKARREREEAERRAREEEEARLEAAIKAEEEGKLEEAEKILDREPIQDPLTPETVVPFKEKLKGLSVRKNWLWELEDVEKVPEEWKISILDTDKITRYVKTIKEKATIPGIRIFSKDTIIQRRS